MENPKNKFVIKKIPLSSFISILNTIYVNGADFFDLHADLDEDNLQDAITIKVPIEYMSEEAQSALDEPPVEEENYEEKSLTKEDIINILKNV